ncbi:MAG: SGNH/GDSL hydrolase family protein [Desulfamplus sp.]|nr:SGNH/GDSL hydrolase family protein [Desulfamplus sp.]
MEETMKNLRSLFITLILSLMIVCNAYSIELKNIVLFGDSLSDDGNLFSFNEGLYPLAPYYKGRFSDGPVWFEYLAEEIGVTGMTLNYAHAGATSGRTNENDDLDPSKEFPGFLDEVDAYLAVAAASKNYPGAFAMPKDTLFIIWIGANDFWGVTGPEDAAARIKQATTNIQNALLQLIEAGASKFLVINLPDLGKLPKYNKDTTGSVGATQLTAGYNNALGQVASGVKALYPDINIENLDAFSILGEFIDNADTYGFANIEDTKFNTQDRSVAEGNYMFWDDVHPTTFSHKIIAKKIVNAINCENCKSTMTPYFENGLTLKIPSAKLGDNSYSFTLVPYPNPTEDGHFWSLDMNSIEVK